ncbi:uncharacterized protein LOC143283518 [Babylonia areolata]|uniref:uncharacterized protein LOC143283518 n=1 Tax=Babylonia areolata TaxID=304850 RepID=UPI003FD0317F
MAFTRLMSVLCWMAAASVTLLSVEGTVVLTGCDGGNIKSTSYIYRNLYCYNVDHCESSFHWTLESNNGTTVSLATCYTPNNCKSFRSEIRINWQNPCGSGLYLRIVFKDYSGTVTCTVITNSAVDRQSCGLNFVQVKAEAEVYNVRDGYHGSTSLGCSTSSARPSTVSWTRTLDTGVTVPVGTCYDNNKCTSLEQPFTLHRYSSSSYISVRNGTRDLAGRFTCSFTDTNQTETADMILNIYSAPTVSNCRIDTIHFNWSAVLSCDVTRAFSSAGIYIYRVQEVKMSTAYPVSRACSYFVWSVVISSGQRWTVVRSHQYWSAVDSGQESSVLVSGGQWSGVISIGQRWTVVRSHQYWSAVDSVQCGGYVFVRTVQWKRCVFVRTVHSVEDICVCEDSSVEEICVCVDSSVEEICVCVDSSVEEICVCVDSSVWRICVSIPSRPYVSCTDVSNIPETGGITCTCTADNLGVPEGRLIWSVGNVTVATGGYGVQQLLLPPDSMTRDKGFMQAVCQLDWIEPQYVMLPWNTTCTKAAAIQKGEDISTSQWKWAGIGAAAMLAVVVVITLLVVLVVWLCRRGRLLHDCRKRSGRQQTDNSGTDTHHYEGLATVRERGPSPRQTPDTDNVYENDSFEEREAHM